MCKFPSFTLDHKEIALKKEERQKEGGKVVMPSHVDLKGVNSAETFIVTEV